MFLKYFLISLILGLIQYTLSAPPDILKTNFMNVLTEYKKLESKIPKEELRTITTLGILNGAIEVEKNLEQHLTESVADLILNLNINSTKDTLPKIEKIEQMIERDRSAIHILGTTMDLARDSITNSEYRNEMKKTLKDFTKRQRDNKKKFINSDLKDRLNNLKIDVLKHITTMQSTIANKANATVVYLEGLVNANNTKLTRRMDTNTVPIYEDDDDQIGISDMFADSSDQNLVQISHRQDVEDYPKVVEDTKNDNKSANQEAVSAESNEENKPGGLAGIIANLSGGDEGSDIGALLGAITGVVSRLFGPNGLDVPSLISTGTSLVAGLLSGGRNFGTVLGEYIGLAFDGFSGGGGAINNGKFLGNLLGTIFAELSADPEDDDEPPKPQIFVENFINTFVEAKSKKGDDKDDEKDDKDDKDDDDDDKNKDKNRGSDSFGFIKHVVKAVVGGVTSFLLNASLGSSSGSSKASSNLFSGSSGGSHGGKGGSHAEYTKYYGHGHGH